MTPTGLQRFPFPIPANIAEDDFHRKTWVLQRTHWGPNERELLSVQCGPASCSPIDCPFDRGLRSPTQVYLTQNRGICTPLVDPKRALSPRNLRQRQLLVQPLRHLQRRSSLGRGTAERPNQRATCSMTTGLHGWASTSIPLVIANPNSSSTGAATHSLCRRTLRCAI